MKCDLSKEEITEVKDKLSDLIKKMENRFKDSKAGKKAA